MLTNFSDAAYFTMNEKHRSVLTNPVMTDFVNFKSDKQNHLWIDSHLTAFAGI